MEEIKKTNELEIIIDDGARRVPIKNTDGEEIGVFYFHPTDLNIISRYNEVESKLDSIVEPLGNVDIAADGTAADGADDSMISALKDAENRLYELTDYLLGGDMHTAFFGKVNPFSPVNGEFYCSRVLDAVGRFIDQQFSAEAEKIDQRIGNYTDTYKPQDHKKSTRKK